MSFRRRNKDLHPRKGGDTSVLDRVRPEGQVRACPGTRDLQPNGPAYEGPSGAGGASGTPQVNR